MDHHLLGCDITEEAFRLKVHMFSAALRWPAQQYVIIFSLDRRSQAEYIVRLRLPVLSDIIHDIHKDIKEWALNEHWA